MATITIPDQTFAQLTRRAMAAGQSLEQYIVPLLERADQPEEPLTGEAWEQEWAEWRREILGRANHYPSGFQLDVSRDAMYEGRE